MFHAPWFAKTVEGICCGMFGALYKDFPQKDGRKLRSVLVRRIWSVLGCNAVIYLEGQRVNHVGSWLGNSGLCWGTIQHFCGRTEEKSGRISVRIILPEL